MTPEAATRKAALDNLQARMGYFFKDPSLLWQAVTHPSATAEEGRPRITSYERLEFLGDSLVNFHLAEILFNRYSREDEGVLTKLRAYWASQAALAEAALELGVQPCIRLGRGEAMDGGASKEKILASVLEALFGAAYLDGSISVVRRLAIALWRDDIRRRGLDVLLLDAKTRLQELRQAEHLSLPTYESSFGNDNFTSVVYLDGKEAGRGRGTSRKAAEQAAASEALTRLGKNR